MRARAVLRLLAAVFYVLWGVGVGHAQQGEKRLALVIGNGAYQAGALGTPANDAGLVAQTLQAAGFDVTGARDLDAATLRASLREFLDKAAAAGPGTVAFVYFAGQGVQFDGENYLVPIDARIARDSDVPLEAVRLTDLTKPLAAMALKARFVVIDAARANRFAASGQPLAGGLALMQPDVGTLVAFNAAPGTIAPESQDAYSAYATALSEMIKQGGLRPDELFERVRLRVNELTGGAEVAWHASRIEAPFLFFERTSAAPPAQSARFSELRTKPIADFDPHQAYLAAVARDTLAGYGDFIAAYPTDPLAKRVRIIAAARREATTWRETTLADTADAYWSYLRRYPHGPHSFDAHRRLSSLAVAVDPPVSFAEIAYDVPPPPEDEIVYVERPVVYFADPVYDLPPPPPIPVVFLPARPAYFVDMAPPPPPVADFVLPLPVYYPVPAWVERPAYVEPPPVNVVNVNIHNTVVINQATETAVVTNPAGQRVDPIPAGLMSPSPSVQTQAAPGGVGSVVQAHPVASAAVAAAAVALPAAAVLRARQQGRPATGQAQPAAVPAPMRLPSPPPPRPAPLPAAPIPGAPNRPAPVPAPVAGAAQPLPKLPSQPVRPAQATQPGVPAVSSVKGAQPLPVPKTASAPGQPALRPGIAPAAPATAPKTLATPKPPLPPQGTSAVSHATAPPKAPAAVSAVPPSAPLVRPAPKQASPQRQLVQPPSAPSATQAAQQRAQQAAQQRAQQAAQAAQQRAQQAAQQRAQQAVQLRAQQAAQQAAQQRAQQAAQAAQQRNQQAAQQRAQQAAQERAQQMAQQRAQQAAQAAQQQRAQHAAQQQKACGRPGTPPCR